MNEAFSFHFICYHFSVTSRVDQFVFNSVTQCIFSSPVLPQNTR